MRLSKGSTYFSNLINGHGADGVIDIATLDKLYSSDVLLREDKTYNDLYQRVQRCERVSA